MASTQLQIQFFSKFKDAFNSRTHSDLTVVAGDSKFYAHKVIIGLRTSFFTNATNPDSGFREANNIVSIKEHSAHAVWRLLMYCYTGDYPCDANSELGEDDAPVALKHAHVYILVDMLDVIGAKQVAAQKLKDDLEKKWAKADVLETIKVVYSGTDKVRDKEIREIVVHAVKEHLDEMLAKASFVDVMEEYGEFAAGLVMYMQRPVLVAKALEPVGCTCLSCRSRY